MKWELDNMDLLKEFHFMLISLFSNKVCSQLFKANQEVNSINHVEFGQIECSYQCAISIQYQKLNKS